MPYIHVNTSKKLSEEQKDALAAAFGRKISLLPGKSESYLMVDVTDGDTMYFQGKKGEFAFVNIRVFGTASLDAQKRLVKAVFETMETCSGLSENQVYVTVHEDPHWGLGGSLM